MSARTTPESGLLWGSRHLRLGLAAWALAALLLLAQGIAEQVVHRGGVTLEFLLRWRLYPVALWAACTPLILAAARRWPVRGGGWPRHLVLHTALFGAWMFLSNLLLRLPNIMAAHTAGLGREIVVAAITYSPTGALLWTGMVVMGRGPRSTAPSPSAGKSAETLAVGEPNVLSLRDGEKTYLVPRESVRWVEADGDYLRVHTQEGKYHVRGPLHGLERRLGNGRFLRIHRSTLVNMAFIREVQPHIHGDYLAILRDGTELRIPRSRRDVIRRLRGSS